MTVQSGSKSVSGGEYRGRAQNGTHSPANSLTCRAKFGPLDWLTFLLWLAIVVAVLDGWWLR
jgi:hypothetical protein